MTNQIKIITTTTTIILGYIKKKTGYISSSKSSNVMIRFLANKQCQATCVNIPVFTFIFILFYLKYCNTFVKETAKHWAMVKYFP